MFGRALAPPKTALAVAPLDEHKPFWKTFSKTAPYVLASLMVDIEKAIMHHVYMEELAQNVSWE